MLYTPVNTLTYCTPVIIIIIIIIIIITHENRVTCNLLHDEPVITCSCNNCFDPNKCMPADILGGFSQPSVSVVSLVHQLQCR